MQTFLLKNLPLQRKIVSFQGALKLSPIADAQDRLKKNWKIGLNVVSAIAEIDMEKFAVKNLKEEERIIFRLCDLLSFASRRGITIEWPKHWGKRHSLIIRGGVALRGVIDSPALGLLIDNGFPKLLDQEFENKTRLLSALHWFLGWEQGPFLELKFLRLWTAIEMLAKYRWEGDPDDPKERKKKHLNRVGMLLADKKLPDIEEIPLAAMYAARNALIHGDVDMEQRLMWEWFGSLEKHRETEEKEFDDHWKGLTNKSTKSSPPVPPYNKALSTGTYCLSRVLEKIFLAFFDFTECWFFQNAKYVTIWSP